VVTLASLVTWQATGGDYYTKFEVVEEVESPIDPNDPLAEAGFYDDGVHKETIVKKEFRLGLLPTPQGVFDKHAISVLSIVSPTWGFTLLFFFFAIRRRRRAG